MAYQVKLEQLSEKQKADLWAFFELSAELKRRVEARRAAGIVPSDGRRL